MYESWSYCVDRVAAEKAAAQIRALGWRAVVVAGDVSRAADVEAMLGAVGRGLGVPHVLVNNAGIYPRSPFLELAEHEWDAVLGVNLKGSFLCAQAAARAMVAAGRRGGIIKLAAPGPPRAPLGGHYTPRQSGGVA